MKKLAIILILLILVSCNENKFKNSNIVENITQESLYETVEFLASPKLNGRLAGTEGYFQAAKYSANKLKEYGCQPMNNESYFQKFNVECNEILPGSEFQLVSNNEIVKNYKLGKDYIFRGFTGSGDLQGEVVFCGYGLSQPEDNYDDYANIDVKDKIALVFKYNPKWKMESSNWKDRYPREKARAAFENGAKAILFVSSPDDKNPQTVIGSVLAGSGEQNENFPQLHVSLNVADDLFSNSNHSLKELKNEIDSLNMPKSLELKSEVKIKVETKYNPEKETVNVVGILEGSDDKLKDQYLVLGAHLDHVGRQSDSVYFPGANDNASGSAAVLEIAKAFHLEKIKPKRSIVFVLFSSEEAGLFGAKNYVQEPPFSLEKTVAMFNFDCVGYGDSIRIGGGKASNELWNMIKKIDEKNTKYMISKTWGSGGADATPFFKAGIPTAYFVTQNSYEHLHKTTDKVSTLNMSLFEKLTELGFLSAKKVADQ